MGNAAEIGRRAALSGALEALRAYRALTERARDEALAAGRHPEAQWAAAEIGEADDLIRGLSVLLRVGPVKHPDLFG